MPATSAPPGPPVESGSRLAGDFPAGIPQPPQFGPLTLMQNEPRQRGMQRLLGFATRVRGDIAACGIISEVLRRPFRSTLDRPIRVFVPRALSSNTSPGMPHPRVHARNLAEKCNVDLEHRERSHSCTGVAVQISPTRHTFRIPHPIHFVDISFFSS